MKSSYRYSSSRKISKIIGFLFKFSIEDVAEVADQPFSFLRVKDNRRTSALIQQPAGDRVRGQSEFNQREFPHLILRRNLPNKVVRYSEHVAKLPLILA